MFHLLMENVKDFAIFLIDPEGRIVSWNAGAERILGFKEAEILGQPFSLIFTPRRHPKATSGIRIAQGRGDRPG